MGIEETKSGYYYSLALHIGIAVALVVFAFVGHIFQKPPEKTVVFQMMDPVPNAPEKPSEQKDNPKTDIFDEPKVQKVKELDIPEEEELQPEPEPSPKPEPQPKESKKPSPKPEPQKKISFSEFRKKNPEKKRRGAPKVQRQNVKIDKITASTGNLSKLAEAKISSNAGASSAMKDALSAYVQYINSIARRNWIMPDSITGLELTCSIFFKVSVSGAISGVQMVKSSGNPDFDNSVLKLFRTIRVDPPPDNQPHTVKLVFTTEK